MFPRTTRCFFRHNALTALALALAAGSMLGLGPRSGAPTGGTEATPEATDFVAWAEASVILHSAEGMGSGAVLSDNGWILTNYHVVESAVQSVSLEGTDATLRVQFARREGQRLLPTDETLLARVYRVDPVHDLALVKVDLPRGHAPLKHYSLANSVRVGEDVFAIGSPGAGVPWTIKRGNVAASTHFPEGETMRVVEASRLTSGFSTPAGGWDRVHSDVIVTTALIASGDSGGPLLNARGELIGLNFACPGDVRTKMSYHIALDEIRAFIADLPVDAEPAPFDISILGTPDSSFKTEVIDADHDGDADILGVVALGENGPLGASIFFDLQDGQTLADGEAYPAGVWGTPQGEFRSHLVFFRRGDGLKGVGYADGAGTIVQIRLDLDGDARADVLWTRGSNGVWMSTHPTDATQLFDESRFTASQLKRLDELTNGHGANLLK